MESESFGKLAPGESKEILFELPPGAKPGDVAHLELSFTCENNRQHVKRFKLHVGDAPPEIGFGCDCGTLSGWLRRFFRLTK
jgi:hypothetical protein